MTDPFSSEVHETEAKEAPKYDKWKESEYGLSLFRRILEKFHHGEIMQHDAEFTFADGSTVEDRRVAVEGKLEPAPASIRHRA